MALGNDAMAALAALARLLRWSAGALIVLGALAATLHATLDQTALGRTVVACLHLDQETSIGNWFSSSVLLLCALLMAHAGRLHRRARSADGLAWCVLALGCAGMSMDEAVGLHERLGNAAARALPVGSLGAFAWLIPGTAVVALGTLAFWRFWRRQAPGLRRALLVAGVCYFGGAVGCEAFGALVYVHLGKESWAYELEVLVEEGLEMAGAVLLFRALLGAAHAAPAVPIHDPGVAQPKRALQAVAGD